jgi:hypothetical protein
MTSILTKAAVRILLPPVAGLLFYGGWAYWVNLEYGEVAALRAAGTQGGYSFTITLILALIIETLFDFTKRFPGHHLWVIAIACALLYSSSWAVNAFMGTPNILWTILPGAILSTIYTISYVYTLIKIKAPL